MAVKNIDRVKEIQEEIEGLMSETHDDEVEVEEDLHKLDEKIKYLEENVLDNRDVESLKSMTNLFVEVCHHLAKDVRAEKEINQEINQLEEDERTYIKLLNRLQSQEISEERRQRLQGLIGNITKKRVKTALKEDKKLKKVEERRINDEIDRLTEVYKDLRHGLKGRRMRSQLENARDAWVSLTHLEGLH